MKLIEIKPKTKEQLAILKKFAKEHKIPFEIIKEKEIPNTIKTEPEEGNSLKKND